MRILLAPMEGVIDHHMRSMLSKIGGIDLCVTEFVRVTDHLLPNKVFFRYCAELDTASPSAQCTTPVRVQLLGSNPIALASNAQRAALLGAVGIDLNFGCPAKTVNKHRGGACLLDEAETLYEIASAVRNAVPKAIPVTAKIRLGYRSRDTYLQNALALASAGVTELVVHARSKTDGYQPPAYWECIGEICQHLNIPVVANGEIWSIEDYFRCRELSGCEDIMLGRGILARPDLALAIKAAVIAQPRVDMNWHQVANLLLEFFCLTKDTYPKKYLGNRVKQWLYYLKLHFAEANALFEEIKKTRDEKVISAALIRHGQLLTPRTHCSV